MHKNLSHLLIISFILFMVSCQGNQKTDLVFSDIASQDDFNNPFNNNLILPGGDTQNARPAEISLILVDRHFLRDKFVDLFDLPVTEYALIGTNAGYTHLSTNSSYDKMMPALMWYGFMGAGCDQYASTNVWPYRTIFDASVQRDNWHESCYYYHRFSVNAQESTTVSPSLSTSPRWAINSRICHQLVTARADRFLVNKMSFDLNNLPDLSSGHVTRLMNVFMPSYQVSANEVQTLLNFSQLYPSPMTNAQKLIVWKNVIEAVCQSPFWHAP